MRFLKKAISLDASTSFGSVSRARPAPSPEEILLDSLLYLSSAAESLLSRSLNGVAASDKFLEVRLEYGGQHEQVVEVWHPFPALPRLDRRGGLSDFGGQVPV